jgi:hypothetical protein
MGPTLDELIEQGEQIKTEGQFYRYEAFWEWHESCVVFLENIPLSFREKVTNPHDAEKGIEWLQATFRRQNGDNHE